MINPASRSWAALRPYLLPAIALLAFTLPHLGQGDWRTDTGRYAAIGLQAWADGLFWTLHTHPDQPWFNKPPLAIWIHGLFLSTFGPSLWVARLPSVIAALGALLGSIHLVRAFHGRSVALAAGLVLALTYEFFRRTREVSLDLWQLMFIVLAADAFARSLLAKRGAAASAGVAGVMLGLALMCKPMTALVTVPIFAALLLIKRRPAGLWRLIPMLAAAGVVALPWHLSMLALHGAAFTGRMNHEVLDRAAGEFEREPLWYYVAMLARTYWPWLPALLAGAVALPAFRGRGAAGLRFAAIWLVSWLVVLSLFPDKAPRYAVPLFPAAAWLAGWWVSAKSPRGGRRAALRVLTPALAALALGAAVFAALPVTVQRGENPAWRGVIDLVRGDPRPIVAIGVDTNQLGRFYLAGLPWPRSIASLAEAPPDALCLRTPNEDEALPPGEIVVYRAPGVLLTRR